MTDPERNLTADHVESVIKDCLFKDDEAMDDMVRVEGILNPFGFHPGRLESHRDEVWQMLQELPTEFQSHKTGGGGGWTFLNACDNRWGEQWTGLHRTMDHLFSLGQALGFVKCLMPRDLWQALPGGMPYYVVERQDDEQT